MCENVGVKPRPRTADSIMIVGLVNNEEGIERFKILLKQKELKPRKYKGRYNQDSDSENAACIKILTENEDVGDYVNLNTDMKMEIYMAIPMQNAVLKKGSAE